MYKPIFTVDSELSRVQGRVMLGSDVVVLVELYLHLSV